MPVSDTITSIEYRNFKALRNYSLRLQHMNILVGPNNCGKSTILSAFRALVAGMRRARTKRPEWVKGPSGELFGYIIPEDALHISIENVHTDYAESDTQVIFRFSNGNKLKLYFSKDGGCVLLTESEGKAIRSPSDFKIAFPVTIGIVPVLGPVEHNEEILSLETVKYSIDTHRASRHFRNYWYHFPEGFDDFAKLVKASWPGMEIERPTRVDRLTGRLAMFCLENRISRELFWAGFGFQVWCQLLTHVANASENSLLIIDEPEIYLHPDVQRQLLSILRDVGPDILIATHSTEIMGEADPSDILLIDKSKKAAERLRDIGGVQVAMDIVGSIQNITLTQLARNGRILFVESLYDFQIIRRFARILSLKDLSSGLGITPIESGGFESWEKITAFAWGMGKAVGGEIHIGAFFDKDYRCTEEVESILSKLEVHLDFAHIHNRKEIENYLLMPDILSRALKKSIAERVKLTGESIAELESVHQLLERITGSMRSALQGQYIAKRAAFLKHTKRDAATIAAETIELFDSKWDNLDTRMEVVSGKDVLRALREEVKTLYSVNITDYRIIDEFRPPDVPAELYGLINKIEAFRAVSAQ